MFNKNTTRAWLRAAVAFLAALLLVAALPVPAAQGGTPVTYVSVDDAYRKLAPDLQAALTSTTLVDANWVRETPDGRLLKLLVLSYDTVDPDLKSLRQAILAAGGSVYYRFSSVNGLLIMLPAANVISIAQRSDVEVMSPNRPTVRTSSLVDATTGTDAVRASPGHFEGTGVGIALLDSGVMAAHQAFLDAHGKSRVKKSVNLRKLGSAILALWDAGRDYGSAVGPGSAGRAFLENLIDAAGDPFQDPFGHGSVVASIAAGRAVPGTMDTTGIAPNASIYDVRVLDETGLGDVADALAAFDWVLYHAKEYGIRVINVSFAADSTTSYLVDPLCRAVRNATAAGLVVIVAAGNFGTLAGPETYGTISSPGDEPSAITVGSSNPHGTATRADDTINNFSSRGPTRGGLVDASGVRHPDNLLKPDILAPGNAIVGALSTNNAGTVSNAIATAFPSLVMQAPGAPGTGLMQLSGTSIAAPVVSGTVALMLQANPGLTAPLIKSMLQYTAQPLPGGNLLEQGAGLVNALGAVDLARSLVPDLSSHIVQGGKLKPGDSLLAPGATIPPPSSSFGGATIPWSRFVFLGGTHVLSGTDLFAVYQPIDDPALTWVGQRVRDIGVLYFDNKQTYVEGFIETTPSSSKPVTLVTSGVLDVSSQLGISSLLHATGAFTPSTVVTNTLAAGGGTPLTKGIVLSNGVVFADSIVLAEGVILPESVVLAESVILAEGILAESVILSESGPLQAQGGAVFAGEP